MKIIRMLAQIGVLFLFYQAGEWISQTFSLMLPGSVLGMILLFLVLLAKNQNLRFVEDGCTFLLKYLPLFFIPITVGVIQYPELLSFKGLLLILLILGSSSFMMVVSGWIVEKFNKEETAND